MYTMLVLIKERSSYYIASDKVDFKKKSIVTDKVSYFTVRKIIGHFHLFLQLP